MTLAPVLNQNLRFNLCALKLKILIILFFQFEICSPNIIIFGDFCWNSSIRLVFVNYIQV